MFKIYSFVEYTTWIYLIMYKRKCKITFICHGATIYSEDNRLFDNHNYPPINTNGKIELEKLSRWLVKRAPKVDTIYSAPSLRAMQSAKIISQEYGVDFSIIEDLKSKKNGIFNGLNFEQIEMLYPELLEQYHNDRENFVPTGGESLRIFDERIDEIIKEIVSGNQNKRLIIVAHQDIIQSAVRLTLDIPIENQTRIYVPTGSATQINYYDGWQSLVYASYVPL